VMEAKNVLRKPFRLGDLERAVRATLA